jgi:hypothetical protein
VKALRLIFLAMLLIAFAGLGTAVADTIVWTGWTAAANGSSGTATGTLALPGGTVTVTYSGELVGNQVNNTGFNYWSPAGTFNNQGPTSSDILQIDGTDTTHTLTFSSPVTNLYMALLSLGQPGVGTTYTFDAPFTIISQGPSSTYGGCNTCLTTSGNSLIGHEGDGLILFNGPITTLTWTGASPEFWNGFTVGAVDVASTSPVPEPTSLMLLGSGILGLGARFRRRNRK